MYFLLRKKILKFVTKYYKKKKIENLLKILEMRIEWKILKALNKCII